MDEYEDEEREDEIDAEEPREEGSDYRRSEYEFERREFLRGAEEYKRVLQAPAFERELRSDRLRWMADQLDGFLRGEREGARTLIGAFVSQHLRSEPELLSLKMLHIKRTWNEKDWPAFVSRARREIEWLQSYANRIDPRVPDKERAPPL